ncbi:MAG: hypothetical protein F4059_08975, partial [Gemmatimonadetes bacterium]|nr:hypothetical protein [Gemmatimonadota bacterium]
MRTFFTAVLALVALHVSLPPASAQQEYWPVDSVEYWTGLINKYTPPIEAGADSTTNGHFCYPLLSGASGAVAEAASQGKLIWDTRLKPEWRGMVDWNGRTPIAMRINPNHLAHSSDYEAALTMAHEGLHWDFGGTPFTYRGKLYTGKRIPNPHGFGNDSIPDDEALVRDIIVGCYQPEEEELCESGAADCNDPPGPPTTTPPAPVCTEQLVRERYTELVRSWEPDPVCLGTPRMPDGRPV